MRGNGLEGSLAAAGKLGGMIGGRAVEAAKQARMLAAGLIDEDGNQVGAGAGAGAALLFLPKLNAFKLEEARLVTGAWNALTATCKEKARENC